MLQSVLKDHGLTRAQFEKTWTGMAIIWTATRMSVTSPSKN